jgi:hypothetical protein
MLPIAYAPSPATLVDLQQRSSHRRTAQRNQLNSPPTTTTTCLRKHSLSANLEDVSTESASVFFAQNHRTIIELLTVGFVVAINARKRL